MKNSVIAMLVAGLTALLSNAAEYVWVNGSSDWGDPSSYRVASEVPTELPKAGDSVKISGAALTVLSSDAAARYRLDAIDYITLDNSTLTFDCAEDVTLKCGLHSDLSVKAEVVKTGSGTLELAAKNKAPKVENNNKYGDVYVDFKIENGALKFYQGMDLDKSMRVRDVTVGEAGELWMVKTNYLQMNNLRGGGLVTNDCASASKAYMVLGPGGSDGVFSGEIHGKFTMHRYGGRTDLLNEDNWWGSTMILSGGVLGLMRFGSDTEGSQSPGSAGKNDMSTRDGGGTFVYLGRGETTTRSFIAYNRSARPITIDAGAHGALTMLGSFNVDAYWHGMYNLQLTGSNTEECVFLGDFNRYFLNGTNYNFYVTKDGTGTWYFKDPLDSAGRYFAGVIEVKSGTLKFDSVAEKGVATSLGTANDLSSQKTGYPRDYDKNVGYAYVLGGGLTLGAMEFVGTSNCRTTTRPAVLAGDGAFINNSTNSELRLKGVSAMSSGAKTLVLGGTNTMENVVWDVTDGSGTVSVEKRGSGSWTLDGTNSFSGGLVVKEGTLVVRNSKGAPYTWFKLLIRQIASTHPDIGKGSSQTDYDTNKIDIVEWALCDANGTRVNVNTDKDDVYEKPFRTLRPAQIAVGKEASLEVSGSYANGNYRGPGELVDNALDSMQMIVGKRAPNLHEPSTWVPVIQRLPEDAGTVATYNLYYGGAVKTAAYRGRFPTAFSIEGSVDGFSWEPIVETNDVVDAKYGWLSGGDNLSKCKGLPIRGSGTNDCHSLCSASSVSVAPGATLKAVGEVTLSNLTVECSSSGFGTVDGFIFAERGVLNLVNVPAAGGDAPLKFTGSASVTNLKNWKVIADGREGTVKASVGTDGRLRLRWKGMSIIVR